MKFTCLFLMIFPLLNYADIWDDKIADLLKKGKYGDAIKIYNKLIDNDLKNAGLYLKRGKLKMQQAEYISAKVDFEISYSFNNSLYEAKTHKALAYYLHGNLKKAIQNFRESLAQEKNQFEAWYWLAMSFKKSNQQQDAIHAFSSAIDLKPKLTEAWNELAKLYAIRSYPLSAVKFFKKSLKHRPENFEIHSNIALAYLQESLKKEKRLFHLQEAKKHLDILKSKQPNDSTITYISFLHEMINKQLSIDESIVRFSKLKSSDNTRTEIAKVIFSTKNNETYTIKKPRLLSDYCYASLKASALYEYLKDTDEISQYSFYMAVSAYRKKDFQEAKKLLSKSATTAFHFESVFAAYWLSR